MLTKNGLRNKFNHSFRTWSVGKMYTLYFRLVSCFLGIVKEYVLVDIDNTINIQTARLSKFVIGNQCDYKKANRLRQLIQDLPIDGASVLVNTIAMQSPLIWFTARSFSQLLGTYIWLMKNGFPIRIVIYTGSSLRKIEFLEYFLQEHRIRFIVDDMKEGYEYGSPQYVLPYKSFLESNNIKILEELPIPDVKKEE